MKKLQAFIGSILLITVSSLSAYPQYPSWNSDEPFFVQYEYLQEAYHWKPPVTYDETLQLLEDLESGELEKKYSALELERINEYFALLAKEGCLPGEVEEEKILEEDSYDLFYGEDNAFQLAYYLDGGNEYTIMPAILYNHSNYDVIQCGKISKAWKKTKKFVSKHKKEIIIGAIVVVAVAVVAVAVISSSTAATVAGAAGAAGAVASDSGPPKSESIGSSSFTSSDSQISSNGAPTFQSAMEIRSLLLKIILLVRIFSHHPRWVKVFQ